MAKGDVLVRMKADVSNYDANIAKARKTLEGFKQDNLTFGGVLNQSTKSIVAAAAQYASFAAVLGTVASGFSEAASKGMEMSREAEGVSKAFARLNQPGLLDNLRQATHNTVNDLELMKQAVKFDNFNLSLEQMGTFLAFAQQQAKDTGQDVNYLVDSIVTGLGRKSLPILDNLGLSAEEIRNRMKETGDMTTAVAEIIQERMEAAGGYVETAADRAAQAQVRLDNAMTELGNTMNSLTGTGATLWTELEIGAVNLANNAIKPLIKLFNELANYINGTSAEDILTRGMTDVTDTVDDNGRLIRKNAIASIPEITVSGTAPKKTRRSGGGGGGNSTKTEQTELQKNQQKINTLTQEYVKISDNANDATRARQDEIQKEIQLLEQRNNLLKLYAQQAQGKLQGGDIQTEGLGSGSISGSFKDIKIDGLSEETMEKVREGMQKMNQTALTTKQSFGLAANAAGALGSALAGIEDPGTRAAGLVLQSIASIALGFAQAAASPAVTSTGWGWLGFLAAGVAAMATTISTVHSLTGYARGGIVEGNSYSGDNMMFGGDGLYGLNAGELVLTKSQQNSLAQQLSGNGMGNINVSGRISGTDILLSADRAAQASGRGQLVTWK
jgi:hypothetical protein